MTENIKEQKEIARLEKAKAFHSHKNYFLIVLEMLQEFLKLYLFIYN